MHSRAVRPVGLLWVRKQPVFVSVFVFFHHFLVYPLFLLWDQSTITVLSTTKLSMYSLPQQQLHRIHDPDSANFCIQQWNPLSVFTEQTLSTASFALHDFIARSSPQRSGQPCNAVEERQKESCSITKHAWDSYWSVNTSGWQTKNNNFKPTVG